MDTFDVCVIGEILVDFLPAHRGRLRDTRHLEVHSGGAPANVAIGVSRLGGTAAIISLIGDDEFGRLAVNRLRQEGVNCDSVRMLPGVNTGLCFVTLDAQGERRFTHRGGDPFGTLSPSDLAAEKLQRARSIAFSCGALRTESSTNATLEAIEMTPGLVCCDPGSFPPSWGDPIEIGNRVRAITEHCDIFKCSREEGERYFGAPDPVAAAAKIFELGPRIAIVTDGPGGAFYQTKNGSGHAHAPTTEVVDTTGAGDAFMAGLLATLTQTPSSLDALPVDELHKALEYACYIGSTAVTERGAVCGIPRRPSARPASE